MQFLFVPFVLLLFANLAIDRYFVQQRAAVLRLVEGRLNPARVALSDLLVGLVDQETGERGYIITGQDSFLGPYHDGQVRVDARLDELDALLSYDADLRAGLQRARSRVAAWRQLGAEFELSTKRAGRDAEAAALVATGTAMTLFDAARAEVADLQMAVREELTIRERRLDDVRRRLTDLRLASAVLGVAVVLLARSLLSRWITRPVAALGDAVRVVAAGDLDHPIPAVGPPDLAGLGRDVEAMRERLVAEIGEASAARAALAQRGMIVLGLRDALAPGDLDLHDGLVIATRFQPAEGVVAGDWFDVIHREGERFVVVLVDISGHGAEAGVFALKTKFLTLSALRNGMGPAESLRWLADQLGDTGDQFLTGVIIEIDASTGCIRYASAGHPPVLVSDGASVVTLGPTGPLLGPLSGDWADARAELPPRGVLAVYSDGLIEAHGADGDQFGVERLAALLVAEENENDPETVAGACMAELAALQGEHEPDDITLVVVGCRSLGHQ